MYFRRPGQAATAAGNSTLKGSWRRPGDPTTVRLASFTGPGCGEDLPGARLHSVLWQPGHVRYRVW